MKRNHNTPSPQDLDRNFTTTLDRPSLPPLRSNPFSYQPARTFQAFRDFEGNEERKHCLQDIWRRLPGPSPRIRETLQSHVYVADNEGLTNEKTAELRSTYDKELMRRCGADLSNSPPTFNGWKVFKEYVDAKDVELWTTFPSEELDWDGNGHLDVEELTTALNNTGMTFKLLPQALSKSMIALSSSPHSDAISFEDFWDFLMPLPRKASSAVVSQSHDVSKFLGDDDRGSAPVSMEDSVFQCSENKPPEQGVRMPNLHQSNLISSRLTSHVKTDQGIEGGDGESSCEEGDDDDESHHPPEQHTAIKFLLAGGIAGAVSRTCTAPFDRLKVFLITRPLDLGGAPVTTRPSLDGVKTIGNAVARIYAEGGILAFWTGNGLSVAKIFPESAIKFFAYESSKRAFGKYWDHVDDVRDISGVSRFLSGGIGGISSQLTIYPIETLKTQMMSNTSQHKRTLIEAARHVWSLGGARAYYRGLTIGLLGVFPYSAIDMSTFEALKLTYLKSTGKDEPGVMAMLAFGSVSSSVGATSVYPLNLVRTRLQASGSSGHPQRYAGVWDVAVKTWDNGGWRAFYRGLFPTLAKVVPAVSISYVVYEHAKRKLGV